MAYRFLTGFKLLVTGTNLTDRGPRTFRGYDIYDYDIMGRRTILVRLQVNL